ncbi:MAG: hypothetical protein HY684_07700 [Chloroflexi bacterium]|nr:hypothetical protein [Chloroflexota bacterium]
MPDEQKEPAAEYYVDQFFVTSSPYTISLTFGIATAHPQPGQAPTMKNLVTLRMSPEHAKVMVMILKRHLKEYESQAGVSIAVPQQIAAQLGIPLEDW